MKYKANFIGRKRGAIGINYSIETITEGKDKNEAGLKLYDEYEHISQLKLTELDTD